MFEQLMLHGAALAAKAAQRRRRALAGTLEVEEADESLVLSGPGLRRRFAFEPALRWLLAGRRR
jgi:hypothetical protein